MSPCSSSMSPPRTTTERSEQTTLNVKQVVSLCERLWKEREDKLREEYDKVLNDRLSGKDITIIFYPKNKSSSALHTQGMTYEMRRMLFGPVKFVAC